MSVHSERHNPYNLRSSKRVGGEVNPGPSRPSVEVNKPIKPKVKVRAKEFYVFNRTLSTDFKLTLPRDRRIRQQEKPEVQLELPRTETSPESKSVNSDLRLLPQETQEPRDKSMGELEKEVKRLSEENEKLRREAEKQRALSQKLLIREWVLRHHEQVIVKKALEAERERLKAQQQQLEYEEARALDGPFDSETWREFLKKHPLK